MANVAHQSRVAGRGSQEPATREPQPAAERGPATRTMASKARRVHSRPRQDALPRPDQAETSHLLSTAQSAATRGPCAGRRAGALYVLRSMEVQDVDRAGAAYLTTPRSQSIGIGRRIALCATQPRSALGRICQKHDRARPTPPSASCAARVRGCDSAFRRCRVSQVCNVRTT